MCSVAHPALSQYFCESELELAKAIQLLWMQDLRILYPEV